MKTDHSITKGYPHEGVISRERFKIRPNIILDRKDKNKIKLWMNKGEYPEYKPATWLQKLFAGKLIDFLEFRLFDYAEALMVAENQIDHLQEEQPFIPEDFGFIKAVGPKEIFDDPTKIYTSKYDENVSLFRNDDEECEWHMLKRIDGAFNDTKLLLPNHRIAYAAFTALGVKIEGIKPQQKEEDMKDQELKQFNVQCEQGGVIHKITLKAFDHEDARSRAKFIFETGDFDIKEAVEFENLTITNQ
jgi:hypothetical protein